MDNKENIKETNNPHFDIIQNLILTQARKEFNETGNMNISNAELLVKSIQENGNDNLYNMIKNENQYQQLKKESKEIDTKLENLLKSI